MEAPAISSVFLTDIVAPVCATETCFPLCEARGAVLFHEILGFSFCLCSLNGDFHDVDRVVHKGQTFIPTMTIYLTIACGTDLQIFFHEIPDDIIEKMVKSVSFIL